jgi:hypothetical protein
MTDGTLAELQLALDDALSGHLCVQTWLGYGQPFFIGFGDTVIPPPDNDADDIPSPPDELQSFYSHWELWDAARQSLGARDTGAAAEEAIQTLVGHRVERWELLYPHHGLQLHFTDGLRLTILPYDEVTEDEEAWGISFSDGSCVGVHRNGRIRFKP